MRQVDFANGKIGQNIVYSALPMLAAQFLSLLYSIVDRIYIGALPASSTAALAGIGLCFPMVSLINGFANLFGSGGAPLCSICRGAGRKEEAQQILNLSFEMTLIAGVILTVLVSCFCRQILLLFGASSVTLPFAASYLSIYALGTLPGMLALAMNPFLQSQGYSAQSMISIALGAAINIVLDPLFIFVWNMGVKGAALATILSQLISCLYVLWILTSPKAELHLLLPAKVRWNGKTVGNILGLGLATFIMFATNSLVQIACNSQLARIGSDLYVSIMTVISSIRQMLDVPVIAISDGTAPVLGYNYGAGNLAGVKKGIWYMCLAGLLYTGIMWTCILLFPDAFISIFSRDPAFIQAAAVCVRIYFAGFFFQAFQFSGQSVFKSLNKKKQAIFFSLLRKVVIVVPLTFLLPHFIQPQVFGVFAAEPISNVIGGTACFACMYLTVYRMLGKQRNG